jgi:hypothetical protein
MALTMRIASLCEYARQLLRQLALRQQMTKAQDRRLIRQRVVEHELLKKQVDKNFSRATHSEYLR